MPMCLNKIQPSWIPCPKKLRKKHSRKLHFEANKKIFQTTRPFSTLLVQSCGYLITKTPQQVSPSLLHSKKLVSFLGILGLLFGWLKRKQKQSPRRPHSPTSQTLFWSSFWEKERICALGPFELRMTKPRFILRKQKRECVSSCNLNI